jgi:predicted DNA binding CopG/RHH family protein
MIASALFQLDQLTKKKKHCMSKKKKKLIIPAFKTEDEERDFWGKVDLSDYFDKSDMEPVMFPNLKPTSASISLRIPQYLLMRIKQRANALNIPYQSLMKEYIARGVSSTKI